MKKDVNPHSSNRGRGDRVSHRPRPRPLVMVWVITLLLVAGMPSVHASSPRSGNKQSAKEVQKGKTESKGGRRFRITNLRGNASQFAGQTGTFQGQIPILPKPKKQ